MDLIIIYIPGYWVGTAETVNGYVDGEVFTMVTIFAALESVAVVR